MESQRLMMLLPLLPMVPVEEMERRREIQVSHRRAFLLPFCAFYSLSSSISCLFASPSSFAHLGSPPLCLLFPLPASAVAPSRRRT